ncbi:MAG: hypothetical protein HFJ17_02500 [Clostridia bacterium]|nr:hypothetical protein [Clostridia bacterium]
MAKREKIIANRVRKILNKKGFLVQVKQSKSSNSIYLRLDNGACEGVRISDHRNDKANYKFNIINGYAGRKSKVVKGKQKRYYNFNLTNKAIHDIEIERANRIINFGYESYKRARDNRKIA